MSELLRLVLDSLAYLWPFRLVKTGELGGYYIFGKFWRTVTPGKPYPVIPWFMDVRCYADVPAIFSTPRLDLTLADGTLLSCVVTATGQMVDYNRAINTVDSYTETMIELVSAVSAHRIAECQKERLLPGARGRFLSDLTRWINAESIEWGIQVSKVRFQTFVFNPRTFRLMQDAGVAPW